LFKEASLLAIVLESGLRLRELMPRRRPHQPPLLPAPVTSPVTLGNSLATTW
jgi:hypothetical protein